MKTEFKASFLKAIRKIKESQLKNDIANAIFNVEMAESPEQIHNLRKLKGFNHYYRIRIGKYRIGIHISGDIVSFVDVDHRRDIYRIFPK